MTAWRHSGDTNAAAPRYAANSTANIPHDPMLSPMMLKQIADVSLPTHWANFRLLGFEGIHFNARSGRESLESALALVLGEIRSSPPVVRIHSQCATGEIFQSLRCDCRDQLHLAMRTIAAEGAGILVYEHQEGRGIGLMEKLRAYELQDRGLDTIEANLRLGHAVDARDYALATGILNFLNVRSIRLMTNNPEKVDAVVSAGIQVVERLNAEVPHGAHTARYLATKRDKLGHFVNTASGEPSLRTGKPARRAAAKAITLG